MLETSARRLACVAATFLLATGCSQGETTAPKASPTPLADLNSSAIQVPRIEFCTLLHKAAVRTALLGYVVFTIPHVLYHAFNPADALSGFENVANTLVLSSGVVLACVFAGLLVALVFAGRRDTPTVPVQPTKPGQVMPQAPRAPQ